MTTTAPSGLARKSVGTAALFFFVVGASAPMTVLAGGVVATYAGTGVVGVPLSFVLLTAALFLATTGYVAMSRYVPHAATFYAYLARGLGRIFGVGGSAVALVAYNAIQISLYGLLGATMAGLLGGTWWVWALVAWAAVALLGVLHIAVNATVLAIVLVAEIAVILLFDLAAFTRPAGGVLSAAPLDPDNLFVNGLGGVLALGIAAFVGYEVAPVYSEEAREPRSVARATFGALLFLGLLYTASAWAMAVAVGPDKIVETARDPQGGLPFSVLESSYGPAMALLASLLLITSIFAAMLSFHNTIARYLFALSRERLLPAALSLIGTGARGGAPTGGSVVQSTVALLVVGVFAVLGADPVGALFTWLSTLAAIGVMLLMATTSMAVIGFFRNGGGTRENVWQRILAPGLGALLLLLILGVTVANISSLLGQAGGSPLRWILPGVVGLTVVLGLGWGLLIKVRRPDVYEAIGRGQEQPLAVLEHQLANVEV
jgi:amino acid transporter